LKSPFAANTTPTGCNRACAETKLPAGIAPL
jgi:hypothetical protein